MDRIDLVDMKLDCILGVLDREQRAIQPLEGRIQLWLDLDHAGHSEGLDQTVNYADVAGWASFITSHGRFRLLESMSVALLRLILLPPAPDESRAQVDRAAIRLRKPTILGELATPGTSMTRDADWAPVEPVQFAEGVEAEALVDTGRSAAWRMHLAPGVRWPVLDDHAVYVISGRVERDGGVSLGPNTALPCGEVDALINRGDVIASLLVVRVPEPPAERGGA